MDLKDNGIDEAIFDWKDLLDRTFDDEKFARELLRSFIDRFPSQLQMLKDAVKNNDFETISTLTHSIKGSTASLSIKALNHVVFEIEEASQIQDSVKISVLLNELEKEYESLTHILSNFIFKDGEDFE